MLELPSQDKVTSLALSPDRRQLLSCCRHDCLQLFDLRGRSHECHIFRSANAHNQMNHQSQHSVTPKVSSSNRIVIN